MRRLIALFVVATAAGPAAAQTTYTWDGGGGTGNWNTAANWVGDTLPVSGTNTRITLAGTAQTSTTQNLGNPFDLNWLTTATGAGAFTVSGGSLRFGGTGAAVVLDSATPLTLTAGVVLNTTVSVRGGGDLNLGGAVSGSGGLRFNLASPSATVTATAANTFTGTVRVNGGTLSLGGAGAITSAGPLFVGRRGAVELNNLGTNTTDRLGNSTAVTLGGGFLTLVGNNTTASSETAGALTLSAGQSTIDVAPGTSAGAQLTFASLATGGSGTVLFNATGNNLGAAPGSGVANVLFTTAPTLVGGGGAAGTTTVSILPRALTTNGPSGDAVTFATYGPNGIRPLTAAEFAATVSSGTATADNVRFTGTSLAITANTTRNALVLTAADPFVSVSAGSTLTLTSGALLTLGNGTVVTGGGGLAFGSRAYITVEGGTATTTIEAPISVVGNAGVVKSGAGTLVLESTATVGSNGVFVNAGTLKVEGAGVLASSPQVRVGGGGTLDVTALSSGLALGSGQTLSGNGTVNGGVRVGSGATIDPTGGDGAGPGTLTVGNTTLLPGGAYAWRLNGVEGGEHSQSRLVSTGTLDLSGLSSANRFTIRPLTLTGENAPGLLADFDPNGSYTWELATYSGGITGFSADKFSIDASGFANGMGGGQLSVAQSGNSLVLNFTPVPEPGAMLLVFAVTLLGGRYLMRRNGPTRELNQGVRQGILQGRAKRESGEISRVGDLLIKQPD